MAQLFSNAQNVLVWLGTDANGLGKGAFDCASLLASPTNRDSVMQHIEYSRYATDLLRSLTSRPWFQRIWTTQEIGLASRGICICGESSIEWQILTAAYEVLISHHQSLLVFPHTFRSELDVLVRRWSQSTKLNFLDLVESVHKRTSTDPRDRIFALLARPSAIIGYDSAGRRRPIIEADYRLSLNEVFTKMAVGIVQQSGSLDILSHVRRGGLTHLERTLLPSWVPNWNEPQAMLPLTRRFPQVSELPHIHRLQALPDFSIGGELHTTGIWCDRISEVLDEQYLNPIYKWKENFALLREESPSPEWSWIDTLCDILDDEREAARFPRDLLDSLRLEEIRQLFHGLGDVPHKKTQFLHVLRLLGTEMIVDDPRRFFVTEKGCIGLALLGPLKSSNHWRTRTGHGIFLLALGKVPYILRPLLDERYRLIGHCYIQSLMDGDAWDGPSAQRMEVIIV